MTGPVRTCVACRGAASRGDLVRLVEHPSEGVVVDGKGRLPGRGAWVHVRGACLSRVMTHPALLHKALRVRAVVGDIPARVEAWVLRGLRDGLALARAGGALVLGHDALVDALQRGGPCRVVFAVDASERTVKSIQRAAGPNLPGVSVPLTREQLGHQVGHGLLSAVGVYDRPSASLLNQRLQQWSELG